MEVKYTKLETESEVSIHSIKTDLTPALSTYRVLQYIPVFLTRSRPIKRNDR
jgi:hypothetical protein